MAQMNIASISVIGFFRQRTPVSVRKISDVQTVFFGTPAR